MNEKLPDRTKQARLLVAPFLEFRDIFVSELNKMAMLAIRCIHYKHSLVGMQRQGTPIWS